MCQNKREKNNCEFKPTTDQLVESEVKIKMSTYYAYSLLKLRRQAIGQTRINFVQDYKWHVVLVQTLSKLEYVSNHQIYPPSANIHCYLSPIPYSYFIFNSSCAGEAG